VWAIIPVKPFKQAKSRLSGILQPDEREALAMRLFQRSVRLLVGMNRFAGVLVISRDSLALKMAQEMGAQTLTEAGQPELNHALRRATEFVANTGASGAFIMPADMPFVAAEDIEQIIHLGRFRPSVVIVPDDKQDGTNGLFLAPPNVITLAYGVGSFHRHRMLALEAGVHVEVFESDRMALDIDTPGDLARYHTASGVVKPAS
jgi:2-phospho-L-lactate guanylyltransferase